MKIEEISLLILHAVRSGVARAVAGHGVTTIRISRGEAYRIYSWSNVDRWLTERLISLLTETGNSSKNFLDRTILESIAASSNRHIYLPVADRKL